MTVRVLIVIVSLVGLCAAAGMGAIRSGATQPGKTIAFGATGKAGTFDIFLLDTRTRLPHNITRTAENEMPIAWSPDGTTLAYYTNALPGGTRIVLWTFDGDITMLPRMVGHNQARWSPDGESILITMRMYNESAGYANKYHNVPFQLPVDGGEPIRLDLDDPLASAYLDDVTAQIEGDFDPLQSPFDQRRLTVNRDDGRYWLERVEGGRTHRLVPISDQERFGFTVTWLDARFVLFFSNAGLRLLDTFDGRMTYLYDGEIIGMASHSG